MFIFGSVNIDMALDLLYNLLSLTLQKPLKIVPVYNDYPRDTKIVAVVDMWSLFRG